MTKLMLNAGIDEVSAVMRVLYSCANVTLKERWALADRLEAAIGNHTIECETIEINEAEDEGNADA